MKTVIWWCLHCARTYQGDEDDFWECAYPDCDGHIGDIREWDSIRELNPEYPEIPVPGERYPF